VVRALAEAEIEDLIRRFVQAACVARDAGFDGVQIQASHGRLLAQFLSPTTNLREDAWGGALEGRARLLIEIARASRAAVGSDFALSVKLGADPEGKDELPLEEAGQVAEWLERERVDLIEAARGPYRGPATAKDAPAMARRRQGYAVAVATAIRARVRAPVMASGGLRDRAVIEELVGEAAVDMVGLGRPLCADPDLPAKFIARSADTAPEIAQAMSDTTSKWASAFGMLEHLQKLHAQAEESWCALAMRDLGEGKAQALKRSARTAVKEYERREAEAVIGLAA
jgi:2,4-dienoyl-CoA reductase-like NADH-dependent reductase (Old Yellow Enzyme family)